MSSTLPIRPLDWISAINSHSEYEPTFLTFSSIRIYYFSLLLQIRLSSRLFLKWIDDPLYVEDFFFNTYIYIYILIGKI